jgi:excisionase family DNA binding protein
MPRTEPITLQSPFWNTKEAAAYCRVSHTTMLELLRRGEIPARRVGNQWRILKADLDRVLAMPADESDRKAR